LKPSREVGQNFDVCPSPNFLHDALHGYAIYHNKRRWHTDHTWDTDHTWEKGKYVAVFEVAFPFLIRPTSE